MTYYMTRDEALNTIIVDMIEKEIESINKTVQLRDKNISQMPKRYFDAKELSEVKLPVEKQKSLITRAIEWIKCRTLFKSRNKNNIIQNENIQEKNSQEFER